MSEIRRQLNFLKQSFPTSQTEKKNERASFLFTSKESARMRKEEIFLISLDGLKELIGIDSRFEVFKDSLFGTKAPQFNRELHNKEINEQLDSTLEELLLLLSPYFLLNPAHKVLEFLIRNYKIHVFNVDHVMGCILPYHDHPLFSRFVQILQIKDTKWEFLEPIQQSGVPLIREILVRRCITDFSILEFICSTVNKFESRELGFKTLFSFATVTMIEYIDLTFISDISLKRILPFIIEGLDSKEQDYKNGSLMIITQLSSKIQLTKLLLEAFLEKIIKNINEYNFQNDLLTIVFLFQSQKFQDYDFKLFEKMIQLKDFSTHLLSLKKYDLTNFLRYFLIMLTRWSISNKSFEMIDLFSTQLNIDKHIPFMIVDIFENFNNQREKESAEIFRLLERVNAKQVDKGINHILSKNEDSLKKLVMKFLTSSLQGIKYVPLDTNTTLFFTLEYPDESVRKLALEKLREFSKNATGENQKFVADALLSRLKDESIDVIRVALNFPNLLEIIEIRDFFDLAPEIYKNVKLRQDFMKVVLNEKLISKNPKMIEFLLPYVLDNILYSNSYQVFTLNYQIASKIKHPLLFNLPKLESTDKNMNKVIIEAISKNLTSQHENFTYLLEVLHRGFAKKLFFKIINKSFDSKKTFENSEKLYDIVKQNIEEKEAIKSLLKIIEVIEDEKIISDIFKTILLQKDVNLFSKHIKTIFIKFKNHLFKFISSFWMNENEEIIQSRSIQMFSVLMKDLIVKKDYDYQLVLPSLIVALANPNSDVRKYSLRIFKTIQESYLEKDELEPIFEGKQKKINKIEQIHFIKKIIKKKDYFLDDSKYLESLLKKYKKEEFLNFLLNEVLEFESLHPKIMLFESFKYCKVLKNRLVEVYANFLTKFISKGVELEHLKLFYLLTDNFLLNFEGKLNEKKYFKILIDLLKMNEKVHNDFNPCLTILIHFSEKDFNTLSEEFQSQIFKRFFELSEQELDSSEITQNIYSILKKSTISSIFIIDIINSLKRYDTDTLVLNQLISIVNWIKIMENISNREYLVEPLFEVLTYTLESIQKHQTNSHIDLLMDATLSSMIYVSENVDNKSLGKFNIKQIIDCIKQVNRSQTRNLCIALLASISEKAPSQVLSHLSSILSILETSLQLDSASYQIIEKTILSILPHALKANLEFKSIAQMFINTFQYIPIEKRLGLFKSLIKIISRKKLHSFILLFLIQHIKDNTKGFYNFSISLMEYYKVLKQVRCAYELVKIVNELINGQMNELINPEDLKQHKSKIISIIFEFLNDHIMNNRFTTILKVYEDIDNRTSQNILSVLLQDCLLLYKEENKQEIHEYNQKIYNYFTRVQELLNDTSFVYSINNLLKIKDTKVIHKTLDLFNYRYSQEREYSEEDEDQIKTLLPKFKKLLMKEDPSNKQFAVMSLEILVKNFTISEEILNDLLPTLIEQLLDENISLAISSSTALATILTKHNLLKFFPQVMKSILRLFSTTFEETEISQKKVNLQQLSMLSSIEGLINPYIKYISPYIGDIIQIIVHKSLIETNNKKIHEKSNSILEHICSNIEPRLILPSLFSSLSIAISFGDSSIIQLLKGVDIVLSKLDKTTIDRFIGIFMNFFKSLFDIRRTEKSQNIEELENSSYGTFKKYVTKLDEKTIKPSLTELVQWSKEEIDGSISIDRLINFYKSINEIHLIQESTFTSFWGTIFEKTIQDLENLIIKDKKKRKREVTDPSSKQHMLIKFISESLKNGFAFDKEELIHNQVRFESVLNALSNQVENIDLTDLTLYQERVTESFVPCLAQLADSIPQNFWKDLQFTFLSKFQNPLPIIKISSIKIIQGFYEKLQSQFIQMLPELIPYLAEILEEDDVEVLKSGKELIQKIEEISGESLEEYFKK